MPAIRVNLLALRERVKKRYFTLERISTEFLATGHLGTGETLEVVLNEEALLAAVEAHFLLSEAYKGLRTDPESPTQPPKIAALSAITFEEFRPLRVIDPKREIRHRLTVHANRLLSLYWAATVFDQDFAELFTPPRSDMTLVRYFRVLRSTQIRSLHSYVTDIENGRVQDFYDVLLDHDDDEHDNRTMMQKPSHLSDMPDIDAMILVFECLWQGNMPPSVDPPASN